MRDISKEATARYRRLSIQPMSDSTPILQQVDALRARLSKDGYLLLRQIVPRDVLEAVERVFLEEMDAGGWLAPRTNRLERLPAVDVACVEPQPQFRKVYDKIFVRPEFHTLAHHPALTTVVSRILGTPPLIHPRKIGRIIFPCGATPDDFTTPAHQDWIAIQGSKHTISCWVPLHDVEIEDGGLIVAHGSHREDLRRYHLALGAGAYEVADREHLDWRETTFDRGDILFFNTMTVHAGRPNVGRRIRLSMDFRYQDPTDVITEDCLVLKGMPYDWEDVYRSWNDRALCYYWHAYNLNIAQFDHRYYAERDRLALAEGARGNRAAISALHRIATFHADLDMRAEAAALIARLGA